MRRSASRLLKASALSMALATFGKQGLGSEPAPGGPVGVVIVGQGSPRLSRRPNFESLRSAIRRLSWRCNSNHGHLLHQPVSPYWLPHGGYHETAWRRDCQSPPLASPCPTLLNLIEDEPTVAPELPPAPDVELLPVPIREPAAPTLQLEAPSLDGYSPPVRPESAPDVQIIPGPRRARAA